MSASQLLSHSFITPVIMNSPSSGKEGIANGGISSNNRAVSPIDQPVHEEPVPDFSFFPGVPGKSRLKCDFEELQFLGKGGFGNVIKVCEIPIKSQTYQWTDNQKWMYRVTERQVYWQTKTDKQRDRRCMVFQAYRQTDWQVDLNRRLDRQIIRYRDRQTEEFSGRPGCLREQSAKIKDAFDCPYSGIKLETFNSKNYTTRILMLSE